MPEIKEQAAQGLGEVIKLTSAQALQPSVVPITGPLIRILGDRFNWNVKAAVLETLALLLAKVCSQTVRNYRLSPPKIIFRITFCFFFLCTGRIDAKAVPSSTSNDVFKGSKRF